MDLESVNWSTFDWQAIATFVAAGVAVWAVVVAIRANRKSNDANRLASEANEISVDSNKLAERANEIALASMPIPRIVLEAGKDPERENHVTIYNVGDVAVRGVQLTHISNGVSEESHSIRMQRFNLEPSAGFGFQVVRSDPDRPIKFHLTGFEQRGEQGFSRFFVVEFD